MSEHSDTHPTVAAIQIALMRAAPGWRKMALLGQMSQTVKTLALNGLRQRHPDATEAALRRALADILLGEELANKAYGPAQLDLSDLLERAKDEASPQDEIEDGE